MAARVFGVRLFGHSLKAEFGSGLSRGNAKKSTVVQRAMSGVTAKVSRNFMLPNVASASYASRPVAFAGKSGFLANRSAHTQADQELSLFLTGEIERERQSLKDRGSSLRPDLKDWQLEKKGAMVFLRRKFEDEQLTVRFNINNSVGQGFDEYEQADESGPPRIASGTETPNEEVLLSRPAFEVEVKRGNTKFAVNCAINDTITEMFGGAQDPTAQRGQSRGAGSGGASNEFVDLFDIEELAVYEGEEMSDETFVMSGDVMDGDMYEHVMNMLDDRGIGPEFTVDLVKLATHHEQEQYVQLLEKLSQFAGSSGSQQLLK